MNQKLFDYFMDNYGIALLVSDEHEIREILSGSDDKENQVEPIFSINLKIFTCPKCGESTVIENPDK